MFLSKTLLKLSGGIGYSSIQGAFLTSLRLPNSEEDESAPDLKVDRQAFSRHVLSLAASAEIDFFIGRHLSLGLTAGYKHIAFHNNAGRLEIPYIHSATQTLEVIPVEVPRALLNAGGYGAGVSLGLHF
jgi:hypothetical protein